MTLAEHFVTSMQSAFAIAVATTFDDVIYLTAFFSDRGRNFRAAHVVAGEFLGFSLLIGASLLAGQLLVHSVSAAVTGWLGVFPILVGVHGIVDSFRGQKLQASDQEASFGAGGDLPRSSPGEPTSRQRVGLIAAFSDRRSYLIAAIAISNGANNLAVYIPVLGNSTLHVALLTVAACYLAVLAWIILSYHLTRLPGVASILSRYANQLFPFVLMWLGFRILNKSGALSLLHQF